MSIELPRTNRIGALIDRVRRPEYTGRNRCLPCTVVNLAIAAVASGLASTLWLPAGVLVAVVSLVAIYLRGYLVPYTPTLTKRYFPDRVLRWFEKEPTGDQPTGDAGDVDVEARLRSLGAITERPDGTDLRLDPAFRRAWHEEMLRVRGTERADRTVDVTRLFDLEDLDDFEDPDAIDVESHDGGSTVLRADGRLLAQWESEAALLADLAADRVLRARHDDWVSLPVLHRSELLGSLRLFLERCPACDGSVSLVGDTVQSCCRERTVAAITCDHCDARLFETDLPEGATGA